MDYIFISDFFVDQVLGGGELNDDELVKLIKQKNRVKKINSHKVLESFIFENINSNYIISNFINLPERCKDLISKRCNYIIYEHDHKYLIDRNPGRYDKFTAPKSNIINYNFYKNSKAVLCQSEFHKSIIYRNLKIDNIISLSGNIWNLDSINLISKFCKKDKLSKCSIMDSNIPHKNAISSIKYCRAKNLPYELIPSLQYHNFLDRISNNDSLVFFPKTPETLSRITVESRMMNMKVITNSFVGATKEEWFKLKGDDLISVMIDKRKEITNIVEGIFNGR